MVESEAEVFVLQICNQPLEVLGHPSDFHDFAKLAAVESVNIDMYGMSHFFEVQDLDLNGRDEAFSSPADPIISIHRVVVGKCDIGHAEPAGFVV